MTKLKFNDGIEIDTSGKLRTLMLHDGLYVIGQGRCIPVKNEEEAQKRFKELQDINPKPEKISIQQLQKASIELNDLLGLEPPIKIVSDRKYLEAKLRVAKDLIMLPQDPISDDTLLVVDNLPDIE